MGGAAGEHGAAHLDTGRAFVHTGAHGYTFGPKARESAASAVGLGCSGEVAGLDGPALGFGRAAGVDPESSEGDEVKALGYVVGFLAMMVLAVLSSFLGAVVLVDMWGWFVAPLGVASITFWHAMGLLSLLSLMKLGVAQVKNDDAEADKEWWSDTLFQIIHFTAGYLFAWGFGAIWHHYMVAS